MSFHLLFMQTPRSRTSNPFSHKRKQKHKHEEKECLQEIILTNGKTDIEQTVSQHFFPINKRKQRELTNSQRHFDFTDAY